jgi:prepilin-type N-terminal cleavage/methylation domain-containing protein
VATRRPAGQHGLTLVEVLIALALLAVVLLPIVIGLSQALATTSEATITAAAASIARDKVEELKGIEFGSVGDQVRETHDLKPGDGYFEVAVAVSSVRADNDAHVGLKNAVVTVYRAGSPRPLTVLSTYLTPFGT